ncbi:MAG: iron ABC transporter permease, partial [bacterium]|nr:iron ABC transporter permease [bacterium]
LLGPRGRLEIPVADWLGVHRIPALSLIGFPAAYFVLSIFTYPYIYLLASAALRLSDRSLEEAAQASGLGRWKTFFRVTLPLLRPAVGAGALLVGLYVLSDFGAVSLTRTDTFTAAIYLQLTGRFDRSGAAALSIVTVILALAILFFERKTRIRRNVVQMRSQWKPPVPVPLGRWKLPAWVFIAITLALSIGIPFALLLSWTVQGFSDQSAMLELWHTSAGGLLHSAWQSLWLAAMAACITAGVGLPIAYLMARFRGRIPSLIYLLAQVGYALPGMVVALSMIFFFHAWAAPLYGTTWMLLAAFLVRFLPESLQAEQASIAQVSPALEDAARSLGRRTWQALREITFPLILPGILAGWSLVFLSSLRELPATLLLRPAGFDPLSVRIWTAADEGIYIHAAPAALLLILVSSLPLYLLLSRGHFGATEG